MRGGSGLTSGEIIGGGGGSLLSEEEEEEEEEESKVAARPLDKIGGSALGGNGRSGGIDRKVSHENMTKIYLNQEVPSKEWHVTSSSKKLKKYGGSQMVGNVRRVLMNSRLAVQKNIYSERTLWSVSSYFFGPGV